MRRSVARQMAELEEALESPHFHTAAKKCATPPCSSNIVEELVSPFEALGGAAQGGPSEASPRTCALSKKLCFDGKAVHASRWDIELPAELVLLIVTVLLCDDVANSNFGATMVCSTWRRAASWLRDSWAAAPAAMPLLASPLVAMRSVGGVMRAAVCARRFDRVYPCNRVLTSRGLEVLCSTHGWLSDDIIALFFCYIVCAVSLSEAITGCDRAAKRGRMHEWRCPKVVFLEPWVMAAFNSPHGVDLALNLGHHSPEPGFGPSMRMVLCGAETMFLPVCVGGSHWILIVLWLSTGVCEVYDSMGGEHYRKAQLAVDLLDGMCKRQCKDSLTVILGIQGWAFVLHGSNSPQQEDGSACGVFACVTAMCICLRRPVVFSQEEIMYWRLRLAFLLTTHSAAAEVRATSPPSDRSWFHEALDGSVVIHEDDVVVDLT